MRWDPPALRWTARRANLLVEGVCLEETTGSLLRVGTLLLEVSGETTPCYRTNEVHVGLCAALNQRWCSGVTCRVLKEGKIQMGDRVHLLERYACASASEKTQ